MFENKKIKVIFVIVATISVLSMVFLTIAPAFYT